MIVVLMSQTDADALMQENQRLRALLQQIYTDIGAALAVPPPPPLPPPPPQDVRLPAFLNLLES